jgi:hypothetical protein
MLGGARGSDEVLLALILAAAYAPVGAVAGAAGGVEPEEADRAYAILEPALRNLAIENAVAEELMLAAARQNRHVVVRLPPPYRSAPVGSGASTDPPLRFPLPLSGDSPSRYLSAATHDAKHDAQYSPMARQGVDAVLEIDLYAAGLRSETRRNPYAPFAVARMKLVRLPDSTVLREWLWVRKGAGDNFTKWAADGGTSARREVHQCARSLGQDIAQWLLNVPIPSNPDRAAARPGP